MGICAHQAGQTPHLVIILLLLPGDTESWGSGMRREERPTPQIGDSRLCLGFTGIIQVETQAFEQLFFLSTWGLATGLQTLL